ncbi:hypothetical protein HQ325_03875 [Rhodococcus sp. BP-349]|uniref:hypothetical protein n=1 Tax=Nocardiaceae TaxID=85025 RepID=UPI000B9A9F52|nr:MULTISPECIES: hypothetical protein [unclassified Rhodococcus (in: high G+C Gram-positive bacteria)]NIL85899.1 hypothetical protein [Rhodococcus fascians]MBY6537803.1 hypothetical protein [Rhodococcus sp. BP-363]MBY6542140.1 hypothetical protein [Rhodococcus sp. BP-369]MBY6561370.1 hypothetical protein [Rhodococcus sp. BP-370]MBY6575662.1 hypothetical protein [Rhodococcus sp. BP-364]
MSKNMRSMAFASAARQAATKSGHTAENWISIENWYRLLHLISLRPGTPFQRAVERYWYSRR